MELYVSTVQYGVNAISTILISLNHLLFQKLNTLLCIKKQTRNRHAKRYLFTVKNLTIFPSPAGMSLTKLSLDGNSLIIPVQGEFGQ
jgi:hypothetical protein